MLIAAYLSSFLRLCVILHYGISLGYVCSESDIAISSTKLSVITLVVSALKPHSIYSSTLYLNLISFIGRL